MVNCRKIYCHNNEENISTTNYAVKVAGVKDGKEVITLDEEKFDVLKKVFWDMNKFDTNIETVKEQHIKCYSQVLLRQY